MDVFEQAYLGDDMMQIIPGTKVMRVKQGYDQWLRWQGYTPYVHKLDGAIVRVLPWEEPVDPSLAGLSCIVDGHGVSTTIPNCFLEPMDIL